MSSPTAGMRLMIERHAVAPGTALAEVSYRGAVHLPDATVAADVTVAIPSGAVKVALGEGATPEMERIVTALVRAAVKSPAATGAALPRKIVRWRG